MVYTAQNQVLMLERVRPKGFWQSVTGSLRWGETARHAAARELYEETGLQAGSELLDLRHTERFPILPPWRERYAPHARFNREHWFALRLPSQRLIRLSPEEHSRYRWVVASVAERMAFSWSNAKAIRKLCGPSAYRITRMAH